MGLAPQPLEDRALLESLRRRARAEAEAICWGRAFGDLERVFRRVIDGGPTTGAEVGRLPVHDLP